MNQKQDGNKRVFKMTQQTLVQVNEEKQAWALCYTTLFTNIHFD